jgi:hypothetical protein
MHIPTLKSNALLSGLKTFYPKFHRMEWVYKDFALGVAIRVMYVFSVTEKVVCLWLKDSLSLARFISHILSSYRSLSFL